jgi:hypothetical protein
LHDFFVAIQYVAKANTINDIRPFTTGHLYDRMLEAVRLKDLL